MTARNDQDAGLSPNRRRSRDALWAVAYLGCYLLLDWVSFIQPYGNLDITPWNPPPGLSLAFLLIRGIRFSPLLFVAQLLADGVVRGFAVPLMPTVLADLGVAATYGAAAWLLLRVFRIDPRLGSLKDVAVLIGLQSPTALIAAGTCVGLYHWAGVIPAGDVGLTMLRYWIGDTIGVAIFTPLFLTLGQKLPSLRPSSTPWISILQGLSILLALWIVFGGDLAQHPTLYYPLFMPLVWVGAWHGLQGVAVALFATQIGMVVAIEEARLEAAPLTEVQFFLLALSITSLFLGALVTERRRNRAALKDSQLRLMAIVQVAPEGVLTVDGNGTIDLVNPAFERLSGLSKAQLSGHAVANLFPGLAELLSGGGGEMQLRRPDGSRLPVEVSVGEADLTDGGLKVAVVHDVSRHRLKTVS